MCFLNKEFHSVVQAVRVLCASLSDFKQTDFLNLSQRVFLLFFDLLLRLQKSTTANEELKILQNLRSVRLANSQAFVASALSGQFGIFELNASTLYTILSSLNATQPSFCATSSGWIRKNKPKGPKVALKTGRRMKNCSSPSLTFLLHRTDTQHRCRALNVQVSAPSGHGRDSATTSGKFTSSKKTSGACSSVWIFGSYIFCAMLVQHLDSNFRWKHMFSVSASPLSH